MKDETVWPIEQVVNILLDSDLCILWKKKVSKSQRDMLGVNENM